MNQQINIKLTVGIIVGVIAVLGFFIYRSVTAPGGTCGSGAEGNGGTADIALGRSDEEDARGTKCSPLSAWYVLIRAGTVG